ncbi:unnamed protein product [Arctia plantaginis]|uniref:Uncharacterized protein n=1 Tax=Arctia plantaginis TaxID=874455 RepID=A0A8S1BMP4_ARCPL|nr:unnamed protein product [Arctia plantaginis]CAB3259827.1 unnamed protein product [Arctia plantaginis]
MFKLVVFTALLAVAAAAPGFIGAPFAAPYAYGHGIVSAPLISTGVVKTALPVATSYSNSVRLSSPTVVAAHAPIVAAHAPIVTAHAPIVAAPAYAHAW